MRLVSRHRVAVPLVLHGLTLLLSAPARADESDAPVPAVPARRTMKASEVPIPWKVWRIFDPKLSYRYNIWQVGPSYRRTLGDDRDHWGVALSRAATIEERRGPLFLDIRRDLGIHVYSPWTFVPIFRYAYEGGVRLGPVELGVGVSAIPFTLEFEHGRFGASGPSPGASARIGVSVGKLRISVRAEREYLWRWGGQPSKVFPPTGKSLWEAIRFWSWVAQPDAMMTSFVLEIGGEQPRSFRSGGHPLIFVK
jgi:hypothetical protein